MKNFILVFSLVFCSLYGFSQETATFTDPRDGKVYKTVKIGNQTWFAENLAYKLNTPAFLSNNRDSSAVTKFGYFYTWEEAKQVAPPGWHLPGKEELDVLYTTLGDNHKKVFIAMIEGGSSGFNALYGGVLQTDENHGIIAGVLSTLSPLSGENTLTGFWSSTKHWDGPWVILVHAPTSITKGLANVIATRDAYGLRVRLIKNN